MRSYMPRDTNEIFKKEKKYLQRAMRSFSACRSTALAAAVSRINADQIRARGDMGWRTTRAVRSFGLSSREVGVSRGVQS
ncbi:hypothetical protein EI94DRAFT_1728713 [Lactarius quietus]|nr:hypothetical protein EI94DRAFT_1728713 [Lactarius quietus]